MIVGAGQAGASVAVHLRQKGFKGSIAMIGNEPDAPYERPPLSKTYLSGGVDAAKLALRPLSFWPDNQVEMIRGERVTAVDAGKRELSCRSGRQLRYGNLVWAAGGHARKLSCPGSELAGVHVVRTRADVDKMREELAGIRNVVIIGGGYIGLETAAVLSKLGKSVTILEAQPRVLEGVTSPAISAFLEREHRADGVQIVTSVKVVSLGGQGWRGYEVVLADGTRLPADFVVVGIGLALEMAPLQAAGARCSNGIEVDEQCRTSLPDVFAVGDCANHANKFADGLRIRLESVQNTNDQGKVAASNIAGSPATYAAVPWFWSHQYDLKLQTVGLCMGHDDHVVRSSPDKRSFSVVYLRQGRVIALNCINAPRDFVQGRKLVGLGLQLDKAVLSDPGSDLARLAAATP